MIGLGGPPLGIVENWVADVWQTLLRIDRPGRRDRFTDLGGDSRSAIEFSRSVLLQFGVTISLDALAARQTIADLVPGLEAGENLTREPVVVLREDSEGPIWLMMTGVGGHAWVFSGLVDVLDGPCDVLAVSYIDLDDGASPASGMRDRIRAAALQALRAYGGTDRPIHVAGYSFGALVATDLVCWLAAQGVGAAHLYLLDPSPLDSHPSFRHRVNRVRSALRIRSRMRRLRRLDRRPSEAERLEDGIQVFSTKLAKAYLDGSLRLPPLPVSWVSTVEILDRYSGSTSVFGSAPGEISRTILSLDHHGLMQLPGITQLGEWLNSETRLADGSAVAGAGVTAHGTRTIVPACET